MKTWVLCLPFNANVLHYVFNLRVHVIKLATVCLLVKTRLLLSHSHLHHVAIGYTVPLVGMSFVIKCTLSHVK